MLERHIKRCEARIAEEERLARKATSPERALAHLQAAMVYRSEVAIIRGRRAATVGEMLAELG